MKNLTFILILISMILSNEFCEAQDWPNLERFKTENEKLDPPAKKEKRVVFMGNSITQGWSFHNPEFFEGKPYINRGIGGQTTPQMLIRFRADVIDLKPKVVVILAGTNDIAGNTGPSTLDMIMDNIKSMAELAKANKIKVVLCSVLPAFEYAWSPGKEPAEKIFELNTMIKEYAEANKMVYLDYYSKMVDEKKGLKSELTDDGVHPTKAGYKIMGPLAEEAIKKAL
ncbi:SGNH/GDSL hydrolase family protein [Carboxylicivirga caseinilyticus]|uniref:SGNH/GDSL hydrolase family protein n=1 Tax=Carboxylicivirga caseinilyticus TaxID=3417572 RepID=UPI003D32F00C|nr:SGNH/GDSL hydrolase family protein [Marinilabiliaceae bacterium A049]